MAEPELIGEILLRIFKQALDEMTRTEFDSELSRRVDAIQALLDILGEGQGSGKQNLG
jgi:hypothetical protein